MEDLIVLDRTVSLPMRQVIRDRQLRIVHEASARVMVIEGSAEGVRAVGQQEGVHSGRSLDAAGSGLDRLDLTQGEVLFVRGWLRRRSAASGDRIGDGAGWDGPGFDAP